MAVSTDSWEAGRGGGGMIKLNQFAVFSDYPLSILLTHTVAALGLR